MPIKWPYKVPFLPKDHKQNSKDSGFDDSKITVPLSKSGDKFGISLGISGSLSQVRNLSNILNVTNAFNGGGNIWKTLKVYSVLARMSSAVEDLKEALNEDVNKGTRLLGTRISQVLQEFQETGFTDAEGVTASIPTASLQLSNSIDNEAHPTLASTSVHFADTTRPFTHESELPQGGGSNYTEDGEDGSGLPAAPTKGIKAYARTLAMVQVEAATEQPTDTSISHTLSDVEMSNIEGKELLTQKTDKVYQFYRNKAPANIDVAKTDQAALGHDDYRSEYYDYTETDKTNDTLVVHPPLVRPASGQSDNEVDVQHSATSNALRSNTSTSSTTAPSSVHTTTADASLLRYQAPKDAEGENYDTYEDEEYYEDYKEDQNPTTLSIPSTPTTPTFSPEVCGTVLNLSQPTVIQNFGRREGFWMQDPVAKTKNCHKIYVTNFYYGNNLIEFESMAHFRGFHWSNSYILPYNWIGTGHMVYNESFYYNRAFSRTLIKYNLRERFVEAWAHLRNAIYDSSTPFTWRGHTTVHIAADETGLWVMYPAYSDFSLYPNVESYVINKIDPTDLRTVSSWRTSLRRSSVSHFFVVCGVIYATDRFDREEGRITYAYDTHTGARSVLFLPFLNKFSFNVQLSYYFRNRKIFSWDNGHQLLYDVNFTL